MVTERCLDCTAAWLVDGRDSVPTPRHSTPIAKLKVGNDDEILRKHFRRLFLMHGVPWPQQTVPTQDLHEPSFWWKCYCSCRRGECAVDKSVTFNSSWVPSGRLDVYTQGKQGSDCCDNARKPAQKGASLCCTNDADSGKRVRCTCTSGWWRRRRQGQLSRCSEREFYHPTFVHPARLV